MDVDIMLEVQRGSENILAGALAEMSFQIGISSNVLHLI